MKDLKLQRDELLSDFRTVDAALQLAAAQRDELLAALREIDERLSDGSAPKIRAIARAAIAKVEEGVDHDQKRL